MKLRGLSALASIFAIACVAMTPACDSKGDTGASDETGEELVCEDPSWVEGKVVDTENDTQTVWGTPCSSDADCSHLGENAECFTDVLGVYELPGGACTVRCELPDSGTTVVLDDPQCDPDGGIACMGAKGIFSACLPPCTDDSQCGREAYGCIRMPTISAPGDAKFCLMNPDACCLDPSMCT